ncbi:MAG: hypothetical protein HQM04_06550 [Magnetococcales bacterium]|nr:hypothetical protein [Magnetococcales bacterium]MBF0114687.1 hypothetical protein [Magnetococcales bacterium]
MSKNDLTVALILKGDATSLNKEVAQASAAMRRATTEMGKQASASAAEVDGSWRTATSGMERSVQSGAAKAGKALQDASKKMAEQSRITAKEIDDSWKDLGVRSMRSIHTEIERVQGAYDTLLYSGKASQEELGRAAAALAIKTAALRKELQGPSLDGQAFKSLGMRSSQAIQAEIAALSAAYQQLSASGKVSLQELERASAALAVKTAALRRELSAPSVTGDAFKTLGVRSSQTIQAEIAALNASYRALARSGTVSLQDLARASDALKHKTAQLTAEMNKAKNSAHGYGGAVKTLVAALAVTQMIHFGHAVVETELALQRARNTLATLTGSARAGGEEFKWLIGMANRAGVTLEEAANGYARWLGATQSALLTTAEARQLFEQLSGGFSRTGATAQETARGIHTLNEMMAEGEFSSRLMKQFAREAPAMYNYLSLAIKETDESVRQVMQRFGELAAKVPDGGLEDARKSFVALRSAIQQAEDTIAKGGLMKALQDVAKEITDKGSDAHQSLTVIGYDLGLLIKLLASLAEALTAPIVQFGLATVAVYKLVAAFRALSLASLAINPATLLISLSAAAAGYALLQAQMEEAQEQARKDDEAKKAREEKEKSVFDRTNLRATIAGEERKLAELRHELHAEEMRDDKKVLDEKLRNLETGRRETEQALRHEEDAHRKNLQALEESRKTTEHDRGDANHRYREIQRRGMSDQAAEYDRAVEVGNLNDKLRELEQSYNNAQGDPDRARQIANEWKRTADITMSLSERLKNVKAAMAGFLPAAQQRDKANMALEKINERAVDASGERVDSLTKKYRQQSDEVERVTSKVDELAAHIAALEPSKTVEIKLKIDAAENRIASLQKDLDKITGKEETVKTRIVVDDLEIARKVMEELAAISRGEATRGYVNGGVVEPLRLDRGGRLPGYGGGDRVPALLEDGEFVMRKEVGKRFGFDLLHAMNNLRLTPQDMVQVRRFASGGAVNTLHIPQLNPAAVGAIGGGSGASYVINLQLPGGEGLPPLRTDRQSFDALQRYQKMRRRSQ